MSVYPADFSEVRRLQYNLGTFPEALLKAGMLMRLDTTNGGVTPLTASGSRPTGDVISGVNNLYGVAMSGVDEAIDPVFSGLPDYAGQAHIKRIFVAVCVPHRELIVFPINKANGEIDYNQAVTTNIGRPVGLYWRNIPRVFGGTTYWTEVGATVGGSETAGYVVGITRDRRLIVRINRSRWAELA